MEAETKITEKNGLFGAGRLEREGSDRIVLNEGGGCLSVFGLPFLAAGVFMLLGFLDVIHIKTEDGAEAAGTAALIFMGLIFSLIGGGLVFGRKTTVIDRARQLLTQQWKLISFPLRTKQTRLREISGVALSFQRGDSDTADRYPISFEGSEKIKISAPLTFGEAMQMGTSLSEFLHVPLHDQTTGNIRTYPSGGVAADKPEPVPVVPRPARLLSKIKQTSEELEISMPQKGGIGCAIVLLFIPAVIIFNIFPSFDSLFKADIHHPGDVIGIAVMGIFVLAFLAPFVFALRRFSKKDSMSNILKITRHTLEVRSLFASSGTRKVPLQDVLGVECSTEDVKDLMQSNKAFGKPKPFEPDYAEKKKSMERTAAFLTKMGVGGGRLIVKTNKGLIELGRGLPREELAYLCYLIAARIGK